MTIERGIVIAGQVLPGTERCIRDPRAWWREPSTDIYPRPRGQVIDSVCGHWTAGPARTGPDAGLKLWQAMDGRRKDSNGDGMLTAEDELMDVSVHLGASWDGGIWQFADLSSATIGAGRKINLRAVHVECMWPGTQSLARRLKMPAAPPILGTARGRRVRVYPPSEAMLGAWRWIVQVLTSADHSLLAIPMRRGGDRTSGILEHCDVKVGRKVDAGGVLVGAVGL